jgi:signal transduction histidine kinase
VAGWLRAQGSAINGWVSGDREPQWRRLVLGNLAVFVGYFACEQLGSVAQYKNGIEVAWLPVGFAAGMLYLGDVRWFVGGMIADFSIGTGHLPFWGFTLTTQTCATTAGNTIEFTLAAILMRRWLGPRNHLDRPADVGLLFVAISVGTALSAVIGTLAYVKWGGMTWSQVPSSIRTWWLGDTSGGTLVAALLIAWGAPPWRLDVRPRPVLQALAILGGVVGVSIAAFSSDHPLNYVVFPALAVAAVYLGQRGATVALALTFATVVTMTAADVGPFTLSSINDAALNTQLYILVATLTTLTLGAAVNARRRAAVELAESRRREAERAAQERERIARDLHDSVSQTLFSLGLHVGIARHEVARTELSPGSVLPSTIDEVAHLAHGALVEMRASIFELRGEAVAEQGLVAALGAHGAALAVRHDVRVSVDGPSGRLPLSSEIEELLFRVGQEAITNAVKHSGSPTVAVGVSAGGGTVELLVKDDGVGFAPDRAYGGHLGLELMRSRAADAGGVLTIESAPATGTTVRAAVPVIATAVAPPVPPAPPVAPPVSVS